MEFRVLIMAPFGRDADVIADVLASDGRSCLACSDSECLLNELESGAGVAIITEESVQNDSAGALGEWLGHQAAWSDLPIILLSGRAAERRSAAGLRLLERLGNVLVLERPLNSETLRRAVTSSLRARARQYESRTHLAESEQHLIERVKAQEALEHLNDA